MSLKFIGGIVGTYEESETSLKFIRGIVSLDEGPEAYLLLIGRIVGSDEGLERGSISNITLKSKNLVPHTC